MCIFPMLLNLAFSSNISLNRVHMLTLLHVHYSCIEPEIAPLKVLMLSVALLVVLLDISTIRVHSIIQT